MGRSGEGSRARTLTVAGIVAWLVFWNVVAWLGNMRLRKGQTAIAVAGDHNPALYRSGMSDVIAGVQLERWALICSLLSLVVMAATLLYFRTRLRRAPANMMPAERSYRPPAPAVVERPALLGVGTVEATDRNRSLAES